MVTIRIQKTVPESREPESKENWVDKHAQVRRADNKMTAYFSFFPPATGDRKVTFKDAFGVIMRAGIVHGVNEEKLRRICEEGKLVKKTLIAQCTPAEKGKDTTFEYLFDQPVAETKVNENGSVDFYETNLITCVKEGGPLLRKIPYTDGNPGMNILGEVIPAIRGADKPIPVGLYTAVSPDDPNLLIATSPGEVVMRPGKVEINPTKSIGSDVDFATGNIRFTGNLFIGGNVKSGFLVESDGNIDIRGVVEDTRVISRESVIVRGGFAGKGKGLIKAEGDVKVQFVENQSIWSDGSIIVGGESLHANLTASKKIIIQGSKATLIGGVCTAGECVETGILGSDAGAWTVIKVGQDPATAKRLEEIIKELAEIEETEERIKKSLYTLYFIEVDQGVLPPEKEALLKKLKDVQESLPEQIEHLKAKKEDLKKNLTVRENARVIVHKKVYPKVRIMFGDRSLITDSEMGPTVFRPKDGEVMATSR